ncbi:MAG: sulfatase-like hydrolase/transferase [Chloroflexota bacterium]
MRRATLRPLPAHPLLLAVYAVLFLASENLAEVTVRATLPALATAAGGALAALLLCGLLFRDLRRGALVATGVVVCVLGYGHVAALLPNEGPLRAGIVAAGVGLLLVTGTVAARAGGARIATLTRGLNVVGAILGGLALVRVGPAAADELARPPRVLGDRPAPVPGDPDVWVLILDRHGSARSLAAYAGIEPRLPGALAERGFAVAEDARANYGRTSLSLASVLSLGYLDDLAARMGPASEDEGPLVAILRDHPLGHWFRERGYEVVQLGSWFLPTAESRIADRMLLRTTETDFDRLFRDTTVLALWDDLTVPEIFHNDNQHRENALWQLRTLERLAAEAHDRPRLILAHILLPHPPYVFREDGAYPDAAERAVPAPVAYARQLRYTEDRVTALVDRLLAVPPAERPVIVVAADEGPYPARMEADMAGFRWDDATDEELVVKQGILLGAFVPGGPPPEIDGRATLVNLFRVILDRTFGTTYGLLPDRVLVSSMGKLPYDLTDVTERLDRAMDAAPAAAPDASPGG